MRKGGADPANIAGSPIALQEYDAASGSNVAGRAQPATHDSRVKTLAPPPPLAALVPRSVKPVAAELPLAPVPRPPPTVNVQLVASPRVVVSRPALDPEASSLPPPQRRRVKGLIVAFALGAATAALVILGLMDLKRAEPEARVQGPVSRQTSLPPPVLAVPELVQLPSAEAAESPVATVGSHDDPPPSAEMPAPIEAARSVPAGKRTQRAARASSRQTTVGQPRPAATQPRSSEPAASIERLPEQPSRNEIKTALEATGPALSACIAPAHGTAFANVTIASSGRVTYSSIEGAFAGTPQGSCMARALRSASFPRFTAVSMKVRYPFVL